MPRRFVATDLHGCLRTFRYLVEGKLRLRPDDTLYLLGDYVNKGPDSGGLLRYLIQLQTDGYQLTCLRGNHDQNLLDVAHGRARPTWRTEAEATQTLASFGVSQATDIPSQYLTWLGALPYEVELPHFVLVHAGFDFALPPAEMRRDHATMLTTKSFIFDASRLGGKRLLHGHMPTPVAKVQASAKAHAETFSLDTGCAYRHNPELRHLAALDLDTWELHLAENREEPYSIEKR